MYCNLCRKKSASRTNRIQCTGCDVYLGYICEICLQKTSPSLFPLSESSAGTAHLNHYFKDLGTQSDAANEATTAAERILLESKLDEISISDDSLIESDSKTSIGNEEIEVEVEVEVDMPMTSSEAKQLQMLSYSTANIVSQNESIHYTKSADDICKQNKDGGNSLNLEKQPKRAMGALASNLSLEHIEEHLLNAFCEQSHACESEEESDQDIEPSALKMRRRLIAEQLRNEPGWVTLYEHPHDPRQQMSQCSVDNKIVQSQQLDNYVGDATPAVRALFDYTHIRRMRFAPLPKSRIHKNLKLPELSLLVGTTPDDLEYLKKHRLPRVYKIPALSAFEMSISREPVTCPDHRCKETIFVSDMNHHLFTTHNDIPIKRLYMGQCQTFFLELTNLRYMEPRCHALFMVNDYMTNLGSDQHKDLLPVFVMSMFVHVLDMYDYKGPDLVKKRRNTPDQCFLVIWTMSYRSERFNPTVCLTLWPYNEKLPECSSMFTGNVLSLQKTISARELISSGSVMILHLSQIHRVIEEKSQMLSMQFIFNGIHSLDEKSKRFVIDMSY